MKNKYRSLIPLALIFLMVVSVFNLISGASKTNKSIKDLMAKADVCIEQQLYDKAADYYNTIITTLDDNISYYLKATDMYFDAQQYASCYTWAEKTLEKFPKNAESYERMIRICLQNESYTDAYTTLDKFDGRKLSSKTVEAYRQEMAFLHIINGNSFDDVKASSGGFTAFQNKEKWGLATTSGSSKIRPKFKDVKYYANELVAVQDDQDVWFLSNANGEYVHNLSKSTGGTITDVGLYNNNMIPICVDGKYHYYNLEFKKVFKDFDYAGSFSGGVAAVKKGNQWEIINAEGANINGKTYTDVILDERGVCCQNDRLFVKSDDSGYIMINSAGERIGNETFESAKLFASKEYAAIQRNGLWGFVSLDGTTKIEPAYEDAGSFCVGLAAVAENGYWGYIDINQNEIIKIEHSECLTFSSKGTAYIRDEEYWSVIKLYKYNH